MNVTLVYPSNSQLISRIPLGPLSLASYLLKYSNYNVKVVDLASYLRKDIITINQNIYKNCAEFLIEKFPSDIYGFSTVVTGEIPSLQIAKEIKKIKPKSKIFFGNQWASFNDSKVLKNFHQVDFIIRGEGEITLKELLECIETNGNLMEVEGISFRNKGEIIRTADRQVIKDLDILPELNFDCLFPSYSEYSKSEFGGNYGILEFGRGCPFACTFCSTSHFWNRRVRTYSIQRTVKDMIRLKNMEFDFIEFTYDNFGTYRDEIIQFCENIIEENVNIKWSIRCRLDYLDEEVIKYLKQAGCASILVGLESGSENVVEKVGKKIDFRNALETVLMLIREGIRVDASFVTGLPFESKSDSNDTLRIAAILRSFGKLVEPEIHFVSPLPGTKATNEAIEQGDLLFSDNTYISPDFSKYLDWSSYYKVDNSNQYRLHEDQVLIDNYPELFTAYGYIRNTNVEPQRFASLSSYCNVLLQFYPVTIAALIDINKRQGTDFITSFEDFVIKGGGDIQELLKYKVETKNEITIGCSEKTIKLIKLLENYFYTLEGLPIVIYEIFKYESILTQLAQKSKYDLISNVKNKNVINNDSVIMNIVTTEHFEYDIVNLIDKIRYKYLIENFEIDWNQFEKNKNIFSFSVIEDEERYYAGVKICKISETISKIINAFDGKTKLIDIPKRIFDIDDSNLLRDATEQIATFVKNNIYMWRIIE